MSFITSLLQKKKKGSEPMNRARLEELAALTAAKNELKAKIDELKAKIDELKGSCLDEMLAEDTTSVKTLYGTFTVGQKKVYEMPQEFRDFEEEYKLEKKRVQEACKMQNRYGITPYLVFTPKETIETKSNQVTIH